MKKELTMMTVGLAVSAALTGCSSELQLENMTKQDVSELKTYTLVINATKAGNDAQTRAIAESSGALSTTWGSGEVVYAYINDATADGDAIVLTPETYDVKTTKLTGTLTKAGGFTTSDVIHLYYKKKQSQYGVYTGQVGTLADIADNFDYATADVNVTSVGPTDIYSTENILATSAATFQRQQAISKFTIEKKGSTDNLDVTPLTIKSDAFAADLTVTPTSAAHEIWVALPSAGERTYKFEATNASNAYGISKTVNLVNDKFYTATLSMGRDAEKLNVTGLPTGSSTSYTGGAVNVSTVKSNENDDMTETTDYETKYYKNTGTPESPTWAECSSAEVKNAGGYKAVITGKGEYEGSTEKVFSIAKISSSEVEAAINANTIPATTDLATTLTAGAAASPIVSAGKDVLGLDSKGLKDNNYVSLTTVPSGIASINDNGEIVTIGGGTITLTISIPADANHEAASVVKTIYVKQSGIGGELPDLGAANTSTWNN